MKHHLYAGIALIALAFNAPAFAHAHDDHDHDQDAEERVVHYDPPAPESHTEALTMLQEKADEIGEVLKKAKLDDNDLEGIHERTYSLEKAVDRLREDATNDAQEQAVDETDEAVQALHFASEKHEEALSREWYAKLKPAIDKTEASFKSAE